VEMEHEGEEGGYKLHIIGAHRNKEG